MWVAAAVALVALVAVVVRNNLDVLGPAGGDEPRESAPRRQASDAAGGPSFSVAAQDSPAGTEPEGDPASSEPGDAMVEVTNIRCGLAADEPLTLKVSLRFHLTDARFREKVLMKRNELRVMVRKVFLPKRLPDIVVDDLRAELMRETVAFVGEGIVRDVEFIDFRPMKQ